MNTLLLFIYIAVVIVSAKYIPVPRNDSFAHLFVPSDEITVNSASHFPKPTRKIADNVTIIVEPTFGRHRSEQDAVFAYAEGYELSYYMQFMETLTSTGYKGDVVLSIAEERIVREDVVDYLKTFAQGDREKPNLVVYQIPLDCDGEPGNKRRVSSRTGDTDGEFRKRWTLSSKKFLTALLFNRIPNVSTQ